MKTMRSLSFAAAFLVGSALTVPVQAAELVTNGGFEASGTGWTFSTTATQPYYGANVSYPHSGFAAWRDGPIGCCDYLSQILATIPGETYEWSFWVMKDNHVSAGSEIENYFSAELGSLLLATLSAPASQFIDYQQYSGSFLATSTATPLIFTFRNDQSFFRLDDVSVQSADIAAPSVPEPATWLMMIGGMGVVGGMTRRRRRRTIVSFA